MKRLAICLTLSLAVTGCTHPVTMNSLTPARRQDVYDCALQHMTQTGYVPNIDARDAGLLVGRRQTRQRELGVAGNKDFDELTVSITEADSGMRKMEVTADRARESHGTSSTLRSEKGPGDKVQGEAQALLNACTEAGIKRELEMLGR